MKNLGSLLGTVAAIIFTCLSAQAAETLPPAQLSAITATGDPIPGVDVKLGRNPCLCVSVHPDTGVQVTYGSKLSVSVGPRGIVINGFGIKENGPGK